MRKQQVLYGYVLIGIGIYFLLRHLDLTWFQPIYAWPTLLVIVGMAFLIHSYTYRLYENIFIGILFVGLGIHFHGVGKFSFWFDHWSVYALIAGIAFFIRYLKTNTDLILSLVLLSISGIMIFSVTLPEWFQWIYLVTEFIDTFWPVALIVIGVYLMRFKK